MNNLSEELKERYENFAKTLDYNTTASDYRLREMEIETAMGYMRDDLEVLDVGCGLGYALIKYATKFSVRAHGIDYSENMVEGARQLLKKNNPPLRGSVDFTHASVIDLPFANNHFDVVTSSRCLMALLDWDCQKNALMEVHRVLKPGGILVLMEGTFEGLYKLNSVREKFGLSPIAADGHDRLCTLKFHEQQLLNFCQPYFQHERTQRFGMYYFLTRVIQPLLVSPEKPSYDHKLNEVAYTIAQSIPDYDGLGHLVAFVFVKRR